MFLLLTANNNLKPGLYLISNALDASQIVNELLNQIGTEKPDTRPKPKVTKKPRTKKVVKQNED